MIDIGEWSICGGGRLERFYCSSLCNLRDPPLNGHIQFEIVCLQATSGEFGAQVALSKQRGHAGNSVSIRSEVIAHASGVGSAFREDACDGWRAFPTGSFCQFYTLGN